MALQAKELQIGDVVMLTFDLLAESGPTFVTRINIQNIAAIDNGKLVAYPIPLTPEILKKNGFEKFGDYGLYKLELEEERIIIRTNSVFIEIYSTSGHERMARLHSVNFHVHEFQHALRLCGLNDLADNLKL